MQKKLSGFVKNCRRSRLLRDGKRGFEIRAAKRTTHSVKRRKYDFYTPSRCPKNGLYLGNQKKILKSVATF